MDRQEKPDIHRSEQGVLNRSFDETYQVLAVEQLVHNPVTGTLDRMTQPGGAATLTKRFDYSSSTIIYTATAPVGTAESSTGWTITKFDLTDTANASGKIATDVSWLNKSAGSYS
jgi:hypothetical protein